MAEVHVHEIGFSPDGATFTYTSVDDFRSRTRVVHQLTLSMRHPDYAEEIELLKHLSSKAVRNALEDHANDTPVDPRDDEDDDEEKGMGE